MTTGAKYTFTQTNRLADPPTLVLSSSYIYHRRIINPGIDDASACVDYDLDVYY